MPFIFTPEARLPFLNLRKAFTTVSLLRHFDPLLPTCMEIDASGFVISAIILQPHPETGHWHPVSLSSWKKSPSERNYGIGEFEMLAIVEACKEWRYHAKSITDQVIVIMNHTYFQKFLVDKQLNRKEARWWKQLSRLDFYFHYRSGKLNPADAPSRQPDYEKKDSILAIKCVDLFKIPKSAFITQKYTSETTFLQKPNQLIPSHQSIKSEFEGPWSFALLGTVRENIIFIARSELLKAATDHESAYKETFLTLQTAIKALQ